MVIFYFSIFPFLMKNEKTENWNLFHWIFYFSMLGEKWKNSKCVFFSYVFLHILVNWRNVMELAPTYISDLVSLKDTGGRYHLRSNNGKLLNIPPYKSFSTLGDRSFCMAAPKLWNDLPLFIRNISSVNAFKKALKTYLFQKEFPG